MTLPSSYTLVSDELTKVGGGRATVPGELWEGTYRDKDVYVTAFSLYGRDVSEVTEIRVWYYTSLPFMDILGCRSGPSVRSFG